ncbi:MAG: transcriptional repressor [Candidatus Abyssobacteria bacterium SURF_17]|uniref:Ferric uptake regulation protein n=1 Tax=Candidatus Abyssobacteria bacterium SURF_17 TaxID=2093361 RepID=A0A419EW38_9BACT|nr:MAG: transcriptional repressor [Candidatus Abyssubacteria bacterium SURF_17]
MTNESLIFKKFLARRDLRFTPERKAILEAVFDTHRHFDADEMVELLHKQGKKISRATVYRTLDLLVKGGLIRAMELGEARKVYEHIIGHKHHDHLICTGCGRIIEFDDGLIELLQQKVCDRLNFQAETHSLRMFGRCENCR